MGYRNREIEIKLLVEGTSKLPLMKETVEAWVTSLYPDFDYVIGNATDLYWHAPDRGQGDFVRLRRTSGNKAQITMKGTDKDDITNRIEIDLEVDDYKQARVLMEGLHGDPIERVKKKYHVYFLENDDTTISVYQVTKDSRVFIEIEGRTKKRVRELTAALLAFNDNFQYTWVNSSLYNIFVAKDGMETQSVDNFLG